jgi:uncharacterized protein YodC (DUF2158 family)
MGKKHTFVPGEIVQLKSGGPDMTVRAFSDNGDVVYCNWFMKTELEVSSFPPETLKLVEEDISNE